MGIIAEMKLFVAFALVAVAYSADVQILEETMLGNGCLIDKCAANGWLKDADKEGCACKACTTCSGSEYRTKDCGAKNDAECKACDTCGDGKYETGACGGTKNRVCATCAAECKAGTHQTKTCSGTQNRVCSSCPNERWCEGGDKGPKTFSSCGADKYIKEDGTATKDVTCEACRSACPAAQHQTVACGGSKNRECANCPAGKYC